MKISVNKTNIENIISLMQPFLDKRDFSSINSHILIEANEDVLIIKATDLEIGLEAKITNVNIIENGKATVNGSNFLTMIKRLKNEDITLEIDNNNLDIKQNKSFFKLPMFNPNEFSTFPDYDKLDKLDIDGTIFIDSIKKIAPSIDTNNPKYELNGALIDILDNKLNFVSTDTRRLSLVSLENFSNIKDKKLILSKKAIMEIQKLFFDEVSFLFDNVYFIVKNENLTFFTKLINGKFPDYIKVVSNYNHNKIIKLNKSILIEGIKLVTSLKPHITLEIEKDCIKFETIDDDIEAKTEINATFDIEKSIKLSINSKYILDFLSSINEEDIYLHYEKSDLPIKLVSGSFIKIIMPLNG